MSDRKLVMRIAITGASGFIGKVLLTQLLADGHTISYLSRRTSVPGASCAVFRGDLITGDGLAELVQDIDAIFHCAGEVVKEDYMADLHVSGTANLLNAVSCSIKKSAKKVHWIQLSSVGAYGGGGSSTLQPRVIDEYSPEVPSGTYEITKTASDRLVREFSTMEPLFTYTIVRPTAVISSSMPNQSFHSLARMVKRRLFFYIGHNNTISNYIYVDDVVKAMVMSLIEENAKNEVFIVSNDCKLEEIVIAFADLFNISPPKLIVPEWPLRFLVHISDRFFKLPLTNSRIDALMRQTKYSSEKIRSHLGFSLNASIPTVLDEFVKGSGVRLG